MEEELHTTFGAIGGINTVEVEGSNQDNVEGATIGIINAVLGILSVVCVAVIIIGGVNYMISTGDAGKVKKAKDTILYAVIGLVVCATAAVLVNFVINNIINGATSSNIANCSEEKEGKCVTCASGYTLKNGKCE